MMKFKKMRVAIRQNTQKRAHHTLCSAGGSAFTCAVYVSPTLNLVSMIRFAI